MQRSLSGVFATVAFLCAPMAQATVISYTSQAAFLSALPGGLTSGTDTFMT